MAPNLYPHQFVPFFQLHGLTDRRYRLASISSVYGVLKTEATAASRPTQMEDYKIKAAAVLNGRVDPRRTSEKLWTCSTLVRCCTLYPP